MPKSRTPLTGEQIQRELDETRASLPILSLIAELFTDPKMFRSFYRFSSAGFSLVDHAPHKMMTGGHKRARGYLFKKFNDDRPGKEQLRNYMHRIEGARLIRNFISERGFSRVMAPRKWLYELPSRFPERYLIVAEKVDLVSREDTEAAYDTSARSRCRSWPPSSTTSGGSTRRPRTCPSPRTARSPSSTPSAGTTTRTSCARSAIGYPATVTSRRRSFTRS